MTLLIRKNMVCSSASNVMATANYSTTPKTLRFAQNVEALGLSKKKRIPIKKRTVSLSLINDKKTDLDCQLYEIRNVLIKLHLQNFFKFTCPSKALCVPIF